MYVFLSLTLIHQVSTPLCLCTLKYMTSFLSCSLSLPPTQVCKVVAGQRIPNQFVPNVAADIVDIAAVPPSNRFNKVVTQVSEMIRSSSGLANAFGLKLGEDVVRVRGRFLNGPKVTVKGSNGQPLTEQVSKARSPSLLSLPVL